MSDLTKTLDDLSKVELADEIVKRDAEIERLNCALIISRGKHENAIREIERLRAVVDAHIKYGLFCDECIEAGRTECVGHVDGQPLAAVEGADNGN